jgi:hypothetical protein
MYVLFITGMCGLLFMTGIIPGKTKKNDKKKWARKFKSEVTKKFSIPHTCGAYIYTGIYIPVYVYLETKRILQKGGAST